MFNPAFWLVVSIYLPWIVFLGVVGVTILPSAPQIVTKPLTWFILASQVRKEYDQEELRRLGESMKALGQLQAIGAKPDGTVLWGHRRFLAARLVGLTSLQVIITDRQMSDCEIRLIQLTENMHRADLSGYEKWLACSELMCMNAQWQMKDLAQHLSIDPSMATRLLSPSKCIPAWQEALKIGTVGISDCYAASKLDAEGQQGLLSLKLSGASRDAIEQAGRKSRNGTTTTVKLSRVKIVMPQGNTLVISGNELNMTEVVELLAETLKEARKASEQYDIKTFQSMMKDKSKAKS